jgi:hypothetical protein
LRHALRVVLLLMGGSRRSDGDVSPPQVKGQEGNPTVPSVATDQAAASRIEGRFRVNRIIVEGYAAPTIACLNAGLEQRILASLNRGSPNSWPARSTTAAT